MRKPAAVTAPTSPFGLSSLGKSDDRTMRRMAQAAPSVALHMPESTSTAKKNLKYPLDTRREKMIYYGQT